MRALLRPVFAIAAAMVWLILPGCRKVYDELKQDPDAIGQFCRIDTMSIGFQGGQQMKVTYNRFGDPETIAPLTTALYGNAFDSVYFRYDKSNRVVDIILVFPTIYNPKLGFYPEGDIDLWYRFSYPAPNVVIDSFYNFDGPGIFPVANPPSDYSTLTVSRYHQDQEGRTIKTDVQYITQVPALNSTTTYYTTYDRKGNAVIPGAVYDDKISIYRTSKVWQLWYQNYSRNNLFYPAPSNVPPNNSASPHAYDKWGLPTILVATPANPQVFFFGYVPPPVFMVVSYSCDGSGYQLQ